MQIEQFDRQPVSLPGRIVTATDHARLALLRKATDEQRAWWAACLDELRMWVDTGNPRRVDYVALAPRIRTLLRELIPDAVIVALYDAHRGEIAAGDRRVFTALERAIG